ncbi:MAG: lysozyme [Patescibacteria group bacterium]|nr:lysozyme [Patescibacteria group bacterium]
MTTVNMDKLETQLTDEEGRKNKAYWDNRGVLSIGIGRNLSSVGLRDCEINYLFENDIKEVEINLKAYLPWVFDLDEVRLRVFYDLCFNMGIHTLTGFPKLLGYAKAGMFDKAADELKDSLWYGEVGSRAPKLEQMLRTGEDV